MLHSYILTTAEPLTVTFGEGDHQKKVHVPVRYFPDSFTATLTAEGDDRIELGRNQTTIEVSLTPQQQNNLLRDVASLQLELNDMKQELNKLSHDNSTAFSYSGYGSVQQLDDLREQVDGLYGLLDDTGKGIF